jgi:AcrR family transcriptional regulator
MRIKKTGRPAEINREDLMDAAEKLFSEHGFEGTTTREVVKRAKCNLALISYYFGSKDGLYQAVLIRHFEDLKSRYAKLDFSDDYLAGQWPELKDPSQRQFCAAIFELSRKITTSGPIQKILCREMMTGANKMVAALSKSEGSAHTLLTNRLRELQNEGKLRRDLDLRFSIVSIIGPIIYSCIASPILKGIYGFEALDEAYVRDLCLHQTRTFFEGWGEKKG